MKHHIQQRVARGEVVGLAGRGDAVVRLASGEAVFVAEGCPGDEVEVAIKGRRAGVLRAAIKRLLSPSAHRAEPFCAVAQRCGGCTWQHVSIEEQRRQKRQLAARALGEIALDAPWVGSLPARRWRRRARMHLRRIDGQLRAGFLAARSHEIVAVTDCPVLDPDLSSLLVTIPRWLGDTVQRAEVAAVKGAEGVVVRVDARPAPQQQPPPVNEAVLQATGVAGLSLHYGQHRAAVGLREVTLEETAEHGRVSCSAEGFCQAGASANTAIMDAVRALLAQCPKVALALEAYSGSGNLTVLLGGKADRVVTIEQDQQAVERARRSVAALPRDIARGTDFVVVCDDAARALDVADDAALWLLDPGRPGARALIERAAVLTPRWILYVSCAFDTLGRDARTLQAAGYRVQQARLVDTFPHTPHFELVALFRHQSASTGGRQALD